MNPANFSPPVPHRLRELLDRALDSQLDRSERDEVNRILASDPDALRYYVLYMDLQGMVTWGMGNGGRKSLTAKQLLENAAKVLPPHAFKDDQWRRYRLAVSLSMALLIVVVGLSVMAIFRAPQLAVRPAPPMDESHVPSLAVAQVTRLEECRFAPRQKRVFAGQSLFAGNTLHLRAGLLEVSFANGAVAVLEGPVEFRIVDGAEGYLTDGRLVARVPATASGFAIATPSVHVVDLGTEFGVEVRNGHVDVAVFQGSVAVYAGTTSAADDEGGKKTPADPPLVLSANEGVRVHRGTGEAAPLGDARSRFARGRAWAQVWASDEDSRTLVSKGFALIHKGQEGLQPTFNETNGRVVVVNGDHRNSMAGLVSTKTFSAADAPDGIRLRFIVDSISSHPMVASGGLRLGVKAGGAAYDFNDDSGRYFWVQIAGRNLNRLRTGVQMRSGQGVATLHTGTAGEVHHNESGAWTDGLVAEILLAPRGWRYEITGLNDASGKPAIFAQSGPWPEGITYADFLDGDFSVFSMVQQENFPAPSNTGIITHRYGRVMAAALPPLPEAGERGEREE